MINKTTNKTNIAKVLILKCMIPLPIILFTLSLEASKTYRNTQRTWKTQSIYSVMDLCVTKVAQAKNSKMT